MEKQPLVCYHLKFGYYNVCSYEEGISMNYETKCVMCIYVFAVKMMYDGGE